MNEENPGGVPPEPQPEATPEAAAEPAGAAGLHPARELSLHLLRMLETRVDAASIAFQGETQC